MRVLVERTKAASCQRPPLRLVRERLFEVTLCLCLAGYALLLALHPLADRVSLYPEPTGNLLYSANFPNHRGAEPWALKVHRSDGESSCGGTGAPFYREVAGERCRALLRGWGAEALLLGVTEERCRYHYAGLEKAQSGSDVSYVVVAGQCVSRNSGKGSRSM